MLQWFPVCLVSFQVAMRIVSQGNIVCIYGAVGSSLSIAVKNKNIAVKS